MIGNYIFMLIMFSMHIFVAICLQFVARKEEVILPINSWASSHASCSLRSWRFCRGRNVRKFKVQYVAGTLESLFLTIHYKTIQTIQYNAIQYNARKYNTVQYSTIQYSTVQYNTIQYKSRTIQCNTIQYKIRQGKTLQCNAIQYNTRTIQYNTIHHNTIQYNTMQCKAM